MTDVWLVAPESWCGTGERREHDRLSGWNQARPSIGIPSSISITGMSSLIG